MITSFLYSVDSTTVSGFGIAFESGPDGSQVLYNAAPVTLTETYNVLTLTAGTETFEVRIDKAYDTESIGLILIDRSSFLYSYTSSGSEAISGTADANYYDNVGPRQRALVQGYEA
jgi:hypothetical protein